MSKSKSKGSKGAASTQDVLTKVKDAAITKPSQSVKAKSMEIAKQVAGKEEKKSKSKKVKEPTPEPSESESEDESGESESSEESESEEESEKPVKNGKLNGTATVAPKPTKKADSAFDEDDSEDESEVSDESESSEDEAAANGVHNKASTAPQADAQSSDEDDEEDSDDESDAGVPAAKVVKTADSSEEEDDDEDDDDDDSDDESDAEEVPAKDKGPVKAEELSKKLNPIAANTNSDEGSDEDSDGSDDSAADSDDSEEDSSDEEEEVKPAQPAKAKRKAEDVAAPAAKKSKTAEAGADEGQGSNLFVGNLSWNVDEEWLTREFEEFGELSGVRIITDRNTGRSKGFGYVEFVNAGDAAKAHAAKKGALVDNRALNIDFANKKSNEGPQERAQSRAKSFGDQKSPPSDTLFVGNLSFDAGQETVTEAFSEWGTILGVRLPTDRETGEPKGFGYVTFSSVDEAKAALENMQGAEIAGRTCRLDFSQPRPQNGESGGRGGGGFGGRGGGRGGFGGRGGGRGGFGDRGGRGGRGRGGFGDRGGRGGRGGSTNRGGFGDFAGKKVTF